MNPLRIDDRPGPCTLEAVRDVLSFMAEAFFSMSSADGTTGSEGATRGAGHILAVCADALRVPDEDESRHDGG